MRFAQYRTSPQQQQQQQQPLPPQQLVLKPLFFEVPQQESDPLFLGREWLVQDINDALSRSQSSGVVVTGLPGTGKTAFVLQLVEYSCFGRLKSNRKYRAPSRRFPSFPFSATKSPVGVNDAFRRHFAVDVATMNGKDRPLLSVSRTIVPDDLKSLASRVVAYHFCQADNNSTCLIPEFVHSLAAQLCQAPPLNMYRQHMLTELNLQVRAR